MLFNAIINISRVSPLIAFLVSFLLSLWIYFYNRKNIKNVLFALFSLDLAIWAFCCYVQSVTKDYEIAFLYDQILYSVAAIAPALFLHCISLFTQKERRFMIRISYLLGFVFFVINWSPFFRLGVDLNFGMRFVTIPYIGWYLYLLAYSIIIVIAMYDLIMAIGSNSGKEKQQLLYVLFAFIVLLLGGQSYFILIFKKINYLVDSILNLSSSVLLATYNLMMAIIITKHSFLNIQILITRTVAYGMVSILLIASFIGLNAFHLPIPIAMTLNALLALFWAWGAHRLRAFIQTPLEEKWITGWYDSGKLLNRIAQRLVPVMEREEVFKTVAEELKSTIKIKNVDVQVGKQDAEYQDVTQTKNGVVIPLLSSDGAEGLIILSQKVSEDPYNEKDLTLLRTIMLQARAIFDRIRPYENIKKDFEANQKKLYDTERLLARSERIASLANLIREYNHEIKTPLSIIRGESALLVKKPRDAAYLEWFKNLVFEQVDRANDIVESTLRLSTPKEHKETRLDLNRVIESALKAYPPNGVHLVKELGSVPLIKGDIEDLQLVFVNLFKNAVEAMPKGGELKIKTYLTQEGRESSVIAEISDTGVGISKENLEKVFEPFFSTHVTRGRGLGLSIVFRIVREHLGKIEVKSQVDKGSTFILTFPAKS